MYLLYLGISRTYSLFISYTRSRDKKLWGLKRGITRLQYYFNTCSHVDCRFVFLDRTMVPNSDITLAITASLDSHIWFSQEVKIEKIVE